MGEFEINEESPDIEAIEKIVEMSGIDALLPEEQALYKQFHPDKSDDNADHYANLAEQIDSGVLGKLATDVIQWVEDDLLSRADWEEREKSGIRLLGFSDKTEGGAGFEGCSKVVHPLLAEAVNQFHSRAIVEMWPPEGPVKTQILGEATPERTAQGERVQDYMNYLYTTKMPGAFDEEDKLLFRLPISGSVFKKSYNDPLEDCIVSRMVEPSDFIVPYAATDLQSAPRFTHRFPLAHNDVLKNIRTGYYVETVISEATSDIADTSIIKQEIDSTEGRTNIIGTEHHSHIMYEMYLDMDLEGFEDKDEKGVTGIGLPYIVTVDKDEQKVMRIQRNYKPDDEKKRKRIYFTHYRFSPGMGFYGYGLLHLIGGLSSAATGALRALLDSAMFANLQGGYKTRDAKVKGGDTPIAPGEWRETDASAEDLSKAFFRIPYEEPSQTLFNLLGYLDERGQRFASTTENMVGEASNTAPVGTTLALIEQGSKAFTAIHKRLHQAHAQEFKLVGELVYEYLPEEGYSYASVGANRSIMSSDFDGRVDIIPVSDPAIISSTQRIAMAQSLLDMCVKFPEQMNVEYCIENMLRAMRVPDWKRAIKEQQANPIADKAQELALAEQQAKIDKLKAEAAVKNIEGQYSAVQAAQTIASIPAVVPIADELLASAGYVDANGAPVATQPQMQQPINPVDVQQNTSPMQPPIPQQPDEGMMNGIETQENDGVMMQ